ncbi:tRNA (adenosine(37)-N6)-threonylcarbamoyltransferase complex ATPase subunit type 1 TsaE [Pedobacter deserti]|uniref:tRNA (adenosine(37)-N6)-threonylcarbamoyltransferase complex ATPase subunit type 1 TsaE n=1 Tax=Pedobacter deserti TaxID=2817382 RepID=UPI00210BC354|nr:tRNA (adenosine(37)-N6)-threonylcarbamoyltransferase complex ATPase subunit type 1 TsaE [Pedobacter sp. SYSU D00382]
MNKLEIEVNGLDELSSAAAQILDFAAGERIFILRAEMGGGKTTLIKELARELGVTEVVSSPTFSIVNEYDAQGEPVYHFDFYRIKDIREAYDIGYEEYFYSGHVCFVEWPEKIESLLPEHYVEISIVVLSDTARLLRLSKI